MLPKNVSGRIRRNQAHMKIPAWAKELEMFYRRQAGRKQPEKCSSPWMFCEDWDSSGWMGTAGNGFCSKVRIPLGKWIIRATRLRDFRPENPSGANPPHALAQRKGAGEERHDLWGGELLRSRFPRCHARQFPMGAQAMGELQTRRKHGA